VLSVQISEKGCVIDRFPRQLGDEQLESLRILSRQVMAQVILGKNLHDLRTALKEKQNLEHYLQKLTGSSKLPGP
jgi:hypothetical protein